MVATMFFTIAVTALSCVPLFFNIALLASDTASGRFPFINPLSTFIYTICDSHHVSPSNFFTSEPSFPAALDVRAAKELGVPKVLTLHSYPVFATSQDFM